MNFSFFQNENIAKNKCFYYLFAFLAFILCIFANICCSKYTVFLSDDMTTPSIFMNSFDHFLQTTGHGRYLGNFFASIICLWMPRLLDLNPIVWHQTGEAVINGVFIYIICYFWAKILTLKQDKPILRHIFIMLFYYYYLANYCTKDIYTSFVGFFSYIFPFMFFISLLYLIIKSIFEEKEYGRKEIIIYSILSFLVGVSTEPLFSTTFIAFSLVILYIKLIEKRSIKYLFIPLFFLVLGITLYFSSPGFLCTFYGNEGAFKEPSLIVMFTDFYTYNMDSGNYDYFVYVASFIFLFFINLFLYKKNSDDIAKKSLLLSTILFLSFIGTFMSIMLTGYKFFCQIFDLMMPLKMILLTTIIIQFVSIIRYSKFFSFIVIGFFIMSIIINYDDVSKVIKLMKENNIMEVRNLYLDNSPKQYYKERYLRERIYLYYIYSNKFPTLNLDGNYGNGGSSPLPYLNNAYNLKMNVHYSVLSEMDEDLSKYVNIVDTLEEAYKTYVENGGPEISEEEIENADFQKLRDRNFVLYGIESRK